MRRTLIIIGAVIVLLALGVGIYFFFFARSGGLTASPGTTFPGSDTSNAPVATTPTTEGTGVAAPNAGTPFGDRLFRISDTPVALGSVAVYIPGTPATPIGTSTASTTPQSPGTPSDVHIEYIEKQSGNIYVYGVHSRTLTRLSNKTLPGIQRASWLSDGSLAFAQFIEKSGDSEDVATYALPSNGSDGYFLEKNLSQVLIRATSTLLTLLSTTDGSSAAVSSPNGAGLHTVFSTPLSSVRVGFSGSNYVVSTKGSSSLDGYAFLVDGKTGSYTRILGPLQGFTALPSPSGKYVLYSYLDRGRIALAVIDLATHIATRMPLTTLPDKCVWTSDDSTLYCGEPTSLPTNLPDSWYQGVSSFKDRLWKIDLNGRVATLVVDPSTLTGTNIDMVGLSLDRTNDVLVFTNKNNGLLYVYDL